MNTTDKIFNRYYEALIADWDDEHAVIGAARLALRLAIADTAALAQPAPQPVGHVSNVTDHQRLFEYAQNQLNRLNEWLAEHEPGLYISPGDTADAVLAALGNRDHRINELNQLNEQSHDAMVEARRVLADLMTERDQLRQQLAQLDADNAGLIAEVDRLTRLNSITTDTFNSLAHTNGANPTPAAQLEVSDWGRSHQAWSGLPKSDLDVIDQLNSGQTTYRRLSATLRRDLAGRVIRHLATDGYLRQHDYETQKPGWMATATAIARLAPDYQWQTLLAEVMAA